MTEHRKNGETGTPLTQEEIPADAQMSTEDLVPMTVFVRRADRLRIRHLLLDMGESYQAFAQRLINRELREKDLPEIAITKANLPSGKKTRRRDG